MSKGLEALDNLLNDELVKPNKYRKTIRDIASVGQVLAIVRELKALEIIKKYIDVNKPYGTACYIYLNDESEMISEEEYELLKEVLK